LNFLSKGPKFIALGTLSYTTQERWAQNALDDMASNMWRALGSGGGKKGGGRRNRAEVEAEEEEGGGGGEEGGGEEGGGGEPLATPEWVVASRALAVRPRRCCSPRHQTYFEPRSLN